MKEMVRLWPFFVSFPGMRFAIVIKISFVVPECEKQEKQIATTSRNAISFK
jgi:hypothetical protein